MSRCAGVSLVGLLIGIAAVTAVAAVLFPVCARSYHRPAPPDPRAERARFVHDVMPLLAAKHGDMVILERENAFRRQQGRALLVYRPLRSQPPSAEALRKAEDFRRKAIAWSRAHGLPDAPDVRR